MTVKITKGTALEQLSMTPLIDIVFLLLIFFLVSTQFIEEDLADMRGKQERVKQMKINLPEASEAKPLTSRPRELFVYINQQGQYLVAGKIHSLNKLQAALDQAYVNNPGRASVVIYADKRVQWNFVVAVMNACNRAKIHDYRVTTREGRG